MKICKKKKKYHLASAKSLITGSIRVIVMNRSSFEQSTIKLFLRNSKLKEGNRTDERTLVGTGPAYRLIVINIIL